VDEHVFLKVNAKRNSLKLGSCSKLATRYCGLFETLERIGLVAYMFSLYASMIVHNLFHVSLLKKYVIDPNHIIDWNVIQVEQIRILDWKVKVLRKKSIRMVKVQ